jgi:nucleoside phosphorylase
LAASPHSVDFALLLALGLERDVFHGVFLPACSKHTRYDDTGDEVYELTTREGDSVTCSVYCMENATPLEAAMQTIAMRRRLSPKCLVSIGIAGAIGDRVRLGDVVVANVVFDYLHRVRIEDPTNSDPANKNSDRDYSVVLKGSLSPAHVSEKLADFAATPGDDLKKRWAEAGERKIKDFLDKKSAVRTSLIMGACLRDEWPPHLFKGPIASSSALVSSRNLKRWLLDNSGRHFDAVEMESVGLLKAASLDLGNDAPATLVIRLCSASM